MKGLAGARTIARRNASEGRGRHGIDTTPCILGRVSAPRSRKSTVALAVAIAAALATWYWTRQPHGAAMDLPVRPPPIREETREREKPVPRDAVSRAAGFDFYLMTMSLHAAFCADGHERMAECAVRAPRPLVIHGLWPERLEVGAYPRDCPAQRLDLDPALAAELEPYMPGMRSDLHEHEWRKHGGCAGLDDDVYFRAALGLAKTLDAALSRALTTRDETGARELRAAADAERAGLGATLVFQCRTLRGAAGAPASGRRQPVLVEIRQCVDDDGPDGAPGTPIACATVNRRDQGCGARFRIAAEPPR
jgi:ribonuclease I